MLGNAVTLYPSYGLTETVGGDNWEAWQWQPTLTVHDPENVLTLETPVPQGMVGRIMLMGAGR